MSCFDNAVDFMLVNECGPMFSDKVAIDNDGGLVKYGINSKSNPDLLILYGARLERLDLAAAKLEYKARYWLPIMDQLKSQRVAAKVLDALVNMGKVPAVKLLQQAVTVLGITVPCDGVMGPQTIMAANAMQEDGLIYELCVQARTRYSKIVQAHPEDQPYLAGWMARASKVPA